MEKWIKIYEEPIGNSLDGIDVENYKIWLNDILEDEAIPYKNSIRYDSGFALSFGDGAFIIEVYIYEKDAIFAKELIEKYNSTTAIPEEILPEELNVDEEKEKEEIYQELLKKYGSDEDIPLYELEENGLIMDVDEDEYEEE